MTKFKIALVENSGNDFIKSRVKFAQFLISKGYQVTAIIPENIDCTVLKEKNIDVIILPYNLKKGIILKLKYAFHLYKVLSKSNFDIHHFYRLQPNLIGTIISVIANKNAKIINHVTGLGLLFSSQRPIHRVQRIIVKLIYLINSICFKPTIIFQNFEDPNDLGLKNYRKTKVILGSSVNEEVYYPCKDDKKLTLNSFPELDSNKIIFLFASRLIKEKGILELINAFKILKDSKYHLLIAGWTDKSNYHYISETVILKLIEDCPNITFLGKREDIHLLIAKSDIAIFPSYYREGIPRFLLESMSMEKPIITTNLPGCKETVFDNGILLNEISQDEIISCIKKISKLDTKTLGEKSGLLYKERFSEKVIFEQILNLYENEMNKS